MTAGDRFKSWIEGLSDAWKDRLFGWLVSWAVKSFEGSLEDIEPDSIEQTRATVDRLRANPATPPEVKALLDKFQGGGFSPLIVLGIVMAVAMVVQTVQTLWTPANKQMSYIEEQAAKTFRFDPIPIITAWRRDPEKYAWLFDDLKDQGWSDERIEALKYVTLFYPAPADLVHWQAREVFEPKMVERYGLDAELGEIEKEPFYKAGMTDEQIRNYWRAHWEHASWIQVVEMLRRGQLTEDQVRDWFRLVEIPPFWRDKLIAISYEVPTRVDVRRFWDMRTIDEARLREIYAWHGYHGKDLDDYVLWTKVYVAFPDLLARWKNGWITLEEVKSELTGYGMPAERVEELIETKLKATQGERTAAERDITKADIIKGVKKGVITRSEGSELLGDLGYSPDDADYILDINIPQDEEDVVVNQRELTKADIIKGLKAKIITEDDALARLLELRYLPIDAEFLLKIYRATIKPPAEPREREASKADIVLAVKKGLITPEDGYLMLQDLGFTPEASQFILLVRAEASPFSSMTFQEFKSTTLKWRKAMGKEPGPENDVLRQAAAAVVQLTKDVAALKESVETERRGLVAGKVLPAAATAKLERLQVSLHRAEAELNAAQVNYSSLLAQWRHEG